MGELITSIYVCVVGIIVLISVIVLLVFLILFSCNNQRLERLYLKTLSVEEREIITQYKLNREITFDEYLRFLMCKRNKRNENK